jgi:hypothetical protein
MLQYDYREQSLLYFSIDDFYQNTTVSEGLTGDWLIGVALFPFFIATFQSISGKRKKNVLAGNSSYY